jgi:enoyl-CoA hydratase/carnithine racemase
MISYRVDGAIAWALLDRPEKLNAMDRAFWSALRETVATADADPDVRVLVFHGAGRCFSVGGDIDGFDRLGGLRERRAFLDEAFAAMRAVEASGTATIAAVHGHALGGGCELTLVCDVVVADETARFGMPEAAVGLVPGIGVVRGTAHVPLHAMKFLVLTGEVVDAQEARSMGLVDRVVPAGEHLAEAERLGGLIAARAPLAVALGKRVLGRDADAGYAHSLETVALLQGTEDHAEGIAAFRERREPRYRGR